MEFDMSLLNKFDSTKLNTFLVDVIPAYNEKILEERKQGKNGKEPIHSVLTEFINDKDIKDFETVDNLEKALFLFLFYQDQDTYYYKKIVNSGVDIGDILKKIEENPDYSKYLNRKLYNINDQRGIMTIRSDNEDLVILFNFGKYLTPRRNDEKQFLVSCRINFGLGMISIGIKDSIFSKIREEDKNSFGRKRHDLVENILGTIRQMNLNLEFESFGEDIVGHSIYKLFKEQSFKADELIKNTFEEEDKEKRSVDEFKQIAETFLRENFVLKQPEHFVEKALSLKYQDQATLMPLEKFANNGGYIFGFSFVEKQITRSDNKSDKKKPIYESKLYWSLKDIIDEYPNLSQLSMYWKFNKADFNKSVSESNEDDVSFIELDYRNYNNELVLYYYAKGNQTSIFEDSSLDRKRREDYALQRIVRYLSAE